MTNILHIIACIAMLEGGQGDGHGYLNIRHRALRDYNAHTHRHIVYKDLERKEVSNKVAIVLITEVWCPGETNIVKIGKRWNGSTEYGERLLNLMEAYYGSDPQRKK